MNAFTQKFKTILFLLAVFSLPAISFSQIQGSVKDIKNQPLANTLVLLLYQKDSSAVSSILATEEGTFSISNFKPGNYLLGISMLGYKPAYSAPFVIKSENDHIHIGTIIAEEDSHQLEDVNIVAKKPVYQLEIDRMVINVENSIS